MRCVLILVMGCWCRRARLSHKSAPPGIMFLKSTLVALLFLLSLVNFGNAGAAAEIGLIKKLLTTIFDRFAI